MPLAILEPITNVRNRQLIAGPNPTNFNTLTVDPNAVCTPEVANHDLAVLLCHTAMVPGDTQGIEPSIARRVTTHNHHRTIQVDIWTIIEGHKSCGHGGGSSTETLGYDRYIIGRVALNRHYRSTDA